MYGFYGFYGFYGLYGFYVWFDDMGRYHQASHPSNPFGINHNRQGQVQNMMDEYGWAKLVLTLKRLRV